MNQQKLFKKKVNVFISNKKDTAAPIIVEDNPTHQNLIGKIEHLSQVGTLITNFNMIKKMEGILFSMLKEF